VVNEPQLFTKPLYLIVRDKLVERITTGVWAPGTILPNEGQLAQELGISLGTVRRALALLDEERLIHRRQGFGTFVNDFAVTPVHFSNICDTGGVQVEGRIQTKSAMACAANEEVRKTLRLGKDDLVIRIERICSFEGQPYLTEVSMLPLRLFGLLPDDLGTYQLSSLAQRNRLILGRAIETVRPILADSIACADLQVDEGTPLLLLDRIAFSTEGVPLEWKVGRCRIDRVLYRVEYT
jgi:GntR family transcriptional regulator